MSSRGVDRRRSIAATGGLFLSAVALVAAVRAGYGQTVVIYGGLAAVAVSIAYLLWSADPAWTLAGGLVLSIFSGHWQLLGLPGGYVAPDRFLIVGGLIAIALRGPWSRGRPALPRHRAHLWLAAAAGYVLVSGVVAGTIPEAENTIKWLEAFGVLPFLVFYLAPAAFASERSRRVLLVALVGLGAYLGLTALFETVGFTSLVFPRYINDPNVGIHFGRARGPFVEAVTNGTALYACALACVMAFGIWRGPAKRTLAAGIGLLCLAGTLFTLQRSVWVSVVLTTVAICILIPSLRRLFVPAALAGALAVAVALAVVPGLDQKVQDRASNKGTIYDRKNLSRTALSMVQARPLFGFGWDTFPTVSVEYAQQADYPLTAVGEETHNEFLGYAADLGLVGFTLWFGAVVVGVGTALFSRGPPELRPWRLALGAYTIFYFVVSSFVPPQVFPNLLLWLLAGVVWSGRLARGPEPAHERP